MNSLQYPRFGQYTIDMSKNGLIISADDTFLSITGYSREDIDAGKISYFDLIESDDIMYYRQFDDHNSSLKFGGHFIRTKNGNRINAVSFKANESDGDEATMFVGKCSDIKNLISEYNDTKSELNALNNDIPGGVCFLEINSECIKIVKYNNEFFKMFKMTSHEEKACLEDLIEISGYKEFRAKLLSCVVEHKSLNNYQLKTTLCDGTVKWLGFFCSLYAYQNEHPLFHAIVFDVTQSRKLNAKLKMQAERYKIVSENTEEIFFDYDVESDILYMTTPAAKYNTQDNNRIKGYMRSKRAKPFIHPDDWKGFESLYREILDSPHSGTHEFRTNAYDNNYTWYRMPYVSVTDEENKVAHVYGKMYNIQNLKNMKQKIYQDSEYINYLLATDSLTGLLNRKSFTDRAAEIISQSDENCYYGISYSDINGFSYVNDNFGFETGNKVLKEFADIIMNNDTVVLGCRIYSDYFVGLYKASTRDELIESIKRRNLKFAQLQKEHFPASDLQLATGLYIFPRGEKNFDITAAIDNANLARRNIKGSQGVICGIYSQRLRDQRTREQSIANELHMAIKERYVEMFLQPKFSLKTRKIIGAEALCRWRNPDGSYKMPCEFIPVLEKVGYIEDLDFFIFEEVLKTMCYWREKGKKIIPVSVNFSQSHFNKVDFVEKIVALTDAYDINKQLIEIEVTESCFVGDMNSLFYDMKQLRSHGFKIDIDDFGIGYSTLSVLINAPVDIVKIDKSFIDNLENNPVERDYVDKMCALIGSVKKDIIFEGVESEGQASILSSSGYTKAQGWLFDKALSVKEFNRKYMRL